MPGTLESNVLQAGTRQVLVDQATQVFDCNNADVFQVTMGANRTFAVPINARVGARYKFIIIQDGTGSRLGTFTGWRFAGGAPTLTTTAAAIDVVSFWTDGTLVYAEITKAYATI